MKLIVREYDRAAATEYARKWAFGRNPAYYNFDSIGGDCTNFASQCLYAGAGVMNYTPLSGWYYIDLNNRAPAWTSVEYFYRFLTENAGMGPFGEEVLPSETQPGDFIQLGPATGDFYHTPVVIGKRDGRIYVAAHTYDAYARPLDAYLYDRARGIHILGVRR